MSILSFLGLNNIFQAESTPKTYTKTQILGACYLSNPSHAINETEKSDFIESVGSALPSQAEKYSENEITLALAAAYREQEEKEGHESLSLNEHIPMAKALFHEISQEIEKDGDITLAFAARGASTLSKRIPAEKRTTDRAELARIGDQNLALHNN